MVSTTTTWAHLSPLRPSLESDGGIGQMTKSWPDRFAGLATLPMQDANAAIAELERVVVQLGS